MNIKNELDQEILAFISKSETKDPSEYEFNQLALKLFNYQFQYNLPYRKFCDYLQIQFNQIKSWKDIPAIPTNAFKTLSLVSFPISKTKKVFYTSGTTLKYSGKHYLENCILYDASLMTSFKKYLLPDMDKILIYSITNTPEASPHSSLIYMINLLMKKYGEKNSCFIPLNRKLGFNPLIRKLKDIETKNIPIFLMGTSFSFVHLIDFCIHKKYSFHLPVGSRIMETGGYKGKSRELEKEQLYHLLSSILGIPSTYILNEYGMTELGTQFYDNKLYNSLGKRKGIICKNIPPWARVLVINPETGKLSPNGRPGFLRIYDLSNRSSVLAIQTEDIGVKNNKGFEIKGRLSGIQPRGCSLVYENRS